MTRPVLEPGPLDLEYSALTTSTLSIVWPLLNDSVDLSIVNLNIRFFILSFVFLCSDELIVLSASGTAACIDLQLATAEPPGVCHGILCMYKCML